MDQSGVKKEDNWPRVNNDLEGLSYMISFTSILHSSLRMPTLLSGYGLCLVSDVLRSPSLEKMPMPLFSLCVSLPCF